MIEVIEADGGRAWLVKDGDVFVARCGSAKEAERLKQALERESLTVVAFEATPEQDKAIEDVLDVADSHFHAAGRTRTDTLVAVLTDWRKRVKAEYEAKKSEDGDTRTQMHLRLDDDDLRDIGAAVERRKEWDCEPDESDSCELGGMIAEICRGWMERVEHDTQPKPTRTYNADGTVTFVVPVTVRADVLEGRDVLEVRVVQPGEDYLAADSPVVRVNNSARNMFSYRVILGPKPQPAFREGGFYRDRAGNLTGPLERNVGEECEWSTFPWRCKGNAYNASGRLYDDRYSPGDILPGEVIVWRHPGLKAGEYGWDGIGMALGKPFTFITRDVAASVLASWTDPPRAGKWKVSEGQEYATWEGE